MSAMIGIGEAPTTRPKASTSSASGRLTRTSSHPAAAKARTCASVACASPVLVQVMDCTATGAPPPTATEPTMIGRALDTWASTGRRRRRRPVEAHVSSARPIMVGSVAVGGGAPVAVQSMTCTRTGDAQATLAQVRALAAAGCELVRVSLPEADDVEAFGRVVGASPIPIIADIHYDRRLALAAIEAGAAGIRMNPGTMAETHVREIVRAAAEARVPAGGGGEAGQPAAAGQADVPVAIRIGVNAGSLPRDLRGKAEREPAAALVEAALRWAAQF